MRNRKNKDIRKALIEADMTQTELAKLIGIHRFSMSRKLHYTLSDKEKDRLMRIIKEYKKEN